MKRVLLLAKVTAAGLLKMGDQFSDWVLAPPCADGVVPERRSVVSCLFFVRGQRLSWSRHAN